jgi:rare lipoprotein A (peptidoglycan hydrolase)
MATRQLSFALRIAATAAIVVFAVPTFAVPTSAAAEQQPTLSELKDTRQTLIRDIAAATDRLAELEATASMVAGRLSAQSFVMEQARVAVAHHAVSAFVDAADSDQVTGLRRRTWAETLSAGDRGQLDQFHAEELDLRTTQQLADETADELRKARDTMTALKADLERTILDRQAAADAEAAKARAAATSAGATTRSARAVQTTRSQEELMAQFPFGPLGGLPASLTPTGTVIDGKASWYGPGFDGNLTASGAVFDQEGWTVASRTLPLGTMLLISRGERQILVLVNDRGPFVDGRVLDLSMGVARALDMISAGVAQVRAEVVVPT